MILQENKFGYDPDEYDDEPSDYVNSETAYDADDISEAEHDELDEDALEDDDDDLDDLDNEVIDDESDVEENDPINDDVSDYPSTEHAAFHDADKKAVYIKDMPYIDHATPGVTSH